MVSASKGWGGVIGARASDLRSRYPATAAVPMAIPARISENRRVILANLHRVGLVCGAVDVYTHQRVPDPTPGVSPL